MQRTALCCLFPSASCFYALGGWPHLPALAALTRSGQNRRIYGQKAERRHSEEGGGKENQRGCYQGEMESLGLIFFLNTAEERETGLTPLYFVRESALCCCKLSLNHQTQLIIVEEAQKAGKGGGAWLDCQREAGLSVCVWWLAGWLTLDLAAPFFSVYSGRLVGIMKSN